MNRYRELDILKSSRGVRYYETTIPTTPSISNNDIYIISKRGDRLDIYADKFYNDVTKWHIIATANELTDIVLEPNIQIRIPTIT